MGGRGRRVLLSYTAELRLPPGSGPFVVAAERAVKLAGDAPMGVEYVTAGGRPPAEVCRERMTQCDVYVLVAGFWYGSLVRGGPSVSYPELEFGTATGLGKPRLVFLLDEEAREPGALVELPEYRARQEAFRRRLMGSGLPVRWVRAPAELETAMAQALAELPAFDTDSAESGDVVRDECPLRAEPMLEHLPAAKRLADKLRSLHQLEVAISVEIVKKDYAAAEQFARIARKHAVEALEAALECAAHAPSQLGHIPEDDIRNAEQLLMITPGAFSSFFAVNPESGERERVKALGELLGETRDLVDSTPVDIRGPHTSPSWLPAVFRMCSAVLVGAAVGAPLGALAVGEPVVKEIVKAGIAVTAGAVAAEATNYAVERLLKPSSLAEAMASDQLDPSHLRRTIGELRPLPEEPWSNNSTSSLPDPEEPKLPSLDPASPRRSFDDPSSGFGF